MESNGNPTSSSLTFGLDRGAGRQSLLTLFIGTGISLLLASPSFDAQAADSLAAAPYHAASSEPERVLDRLIKMENADDNMVLFALKRPDRILKKDPAYRGLFTAALEKSWAGAEAELVRKFCDGKYQNGEICGMNSSPLTCAQDYSERGYLYRTDVLDESSATITMRWPWIEKPVATYRLVKQGKKWALDGVACLPNGPAYNMHRSGDAPPR